MVRWDNGTEMINKGNLGQLICVLTKQVVERDHGDKKYNSPAGAFAIRRRGLHLNLKIGEMKKSIDPITPINPALTLHKFAEMKIGLGAFCLLSASNQ